jgi:hypothetical protein
MARRLVPGLTHASDAPPPPDTSRHLKRSSGHPMGFSAWPPSWTRTVAGPARDQPVSIGRLPTGPIEPPLRRDRTPSGAGLVFASPLPRAACVTGQARAFQTPARAERRAWVFNDLRARARFFNYRLPIVGAKSSLAPHCTSYFPPHKTWVTKIFPRPCHCLPHEERRGINRHYPTGRE